MLADTKTIRKIFRYTKYSSGVSWTNNNGKKIEDKEVRTLGFLPNFEPESAGDALRDLLKKYGYDNKVKVSDNGYVRVMDCKFTPCGKGVYYRSSYTFNGLGL